LNAATQQQLAIDLKTFHEMSIRFVVLGVWRESNKLFIQNPDLQDRVAEIPVEPWGNYDFDRVIDKGQGHLKIGIPPHARDEFKKNSYGNVGLLQELLKIYCRLNGVSATLDQFRTFDNVDTVPQTLSQKADDQKVRLIHTLESIASKSRAERRTGREEPLTLPYYLVHVLLTAPIEEITDGLTRQHLLEQIRLLHRRDDKTSIRASDVVHLIKRLPALQSDHPSPFLYESNNRLKIVDAGLLFALAKCNRQELRDEIVDPLETYDDGPDADETEAST